jgi:hypothetical protein
MVSHLFRLSTLLLLTAGQVAAGAITIYTTGGTPPGYDPQSVDAWDILPSGIQAVAIEFNPSATSKLGEIELPIASVSGSGAAELEILSNTGGRPGSIIESWQLALGTTVSEVTVNSVLNPTLSHGTNYWVAVTTTGSLEVNWYTNSGFVRNADLFLGSWQNSSQSVKPAVEIFSASAPEPASHGLVAIGGLAAFVMGYRRRRRETGKKSY